MNKYADSLGFLDSPGETKVDVLKRPSVSIVHLTSVPPLVENQYEALKEHEKFMKGVLANVNVIHVRQKIDLSVKTGCMGVVFGMQHAPKNIQRFSDVQRFADAGVTIMSLAYRGPTEYGGGFETNDPLTIRGMHLITSFAECGVSLDISHASRQTALNALEFICRERLPVKPLASHSGIREVYDHPRNLSSDILGMIRALDGYVGIPLITFFLCSERNVLNSRKEFIRHVTDAVVKVGVDHVGIGSDCIHRSMTMEQAKENFARMARMLQGDGTFGEYFPDRPEEIITEGSHFFTVVEKWLQEAFHDKGKVRKICGGNFLAYLKKVLPEDK